MYLIMHKNMFVFSILIMLPSLKYLKDIYFNYFKRWEYIIQEVFRKLTFIMLKV